MFWYFSVWTYLKQASNQLKLFNWLNIITNVLFVFKLLNDTFSVTVKKKIEKTVNFIKALWEHVNEHWNDFIIIALDFYVSFIQIKINMRITEFWYLNQ